MAEQTQPDPSTWEEFKRKAGAALKKSFDIQKIAEGYKKAHERSKATTEEATEAAAYQQTPVKGGPGTESVEEQFPETDFSRVNRSSRLQTTDSTPALSDIGLRFVNYGKFEPGTKYFDNYNTPKSRSKLLSVKYSEPNNPGLFSRRRE